MESVSIAQHRIKKFSAGEVKDAEDALVVEEPLEIQLGYFSEADFVKKQISVTMRTPGNDEELAVGFLFTEGIIKSKNEVYEVNTVGFSGNSIQVVLNKDARPLLQNTERNFYTTSSCGVCGKASLDAIKTVSVYKNETDFICLRATVFYKLQDELRNQQLIFESTGGLHASALFDFEGNFEMLREDVGRHNALDKVIGTAFLNEQLPLHNKILLLSGRASFELVQKATMAGLKIIAAVGAPSSLAVHMAEESGLTLIGFLRNGRFNVYTGLQRIQL